MQRLYLHGYITFLLSFSKCNSLMKLLSSVYYILNTELIVILNKISCIKLIYMPNDCLQVLRFTSLKNSKAFLTSQS